MDILSGFQMVGLPDFRSHSKSRPFATQPVLDHSKSRLGQISDPHCIQLLDGHKVATGNVYPNLKWKPLRYDTFKTVDAHKYFISNTLGEAKNAVHRWLSVLIFLEIGLQLGALVILTKIRAASNVFTEGILIMDMEIT